MRAYFVSGLNTLSGCACFRLVPATHDSNGFSSADFVAELNLGDIALLKGDLALAREYLEGVHSLVKDPATSEWMRWRYSMHLFASLSAHGLARGDLSRARECADQCLELATRTDSRKYLVTGWRLQGEIALARGRWQDADRALREALAVARVIGSPTPL